MEFAGFHDPYAEFVSQNPELAAKVQAVVDKGRSHLEHGFPSEARREFQRALALYPHVPAALNNLALLAYGDGDRDRARLYLEQLLEFAPVEPTANALLARHWLEEGSVPLANKHVQIAVQSIIALARVGDTADPSRIRRALEFACQTLAGLEDDGLLVYLYNQTGKPELLPVSLIHVAIAFYNRGQSETAVQLWQKVLELSPEDPPAQVYLKLTEVLRQQNVPPFRLDHQLEMPESEKGRRVWLVHVPSLLTAAALTRLYSGSSEEAEEALPLLVSVGVPGLHQILLGVAHDVTRPARLRLLAGLQLTASGDLSAGNGVLQSIPRAGLSGETEGIWCLLGAVLADANDSYADALALATDGKRIFATSNLPANHPFRQMLGALTERLEKHAPCGETPVDHLGVAQHKEQSAFLTLPDAEWLRSALQYTVTPGLEEMLTHRSSDMVVELARRLGEHAPEKLPEDARVRRLAMRLRSLPLERVAGALSPAARHLLVWLVEQDDTVSLPDVYTWLGKELAESDPWPILEELYRAGLLDIGRREDKETEMPLQPTDLTLLIPSDLRFRFQQN